MKATNIRLSDKQYEQIKKISTNEEVSMNALIREALDLLFKSRGEHF